MLRVILAWQLFRRQSELQTTIHSEAGSQDLPCQGLTRITVPMVDLATSLKFELRTLFPKTSEAWLIPPPVLRPTSFYQLEEDKLEIIQYLVNTQGLGRGEANMVISNLERELMNKTLW